MKKIQIREASVQEVISVADMIPELGATPREEVYHEKMGDSPRLLLVAEVDGIPAGFKVGYERDGYWYSWLGGVLPDHRRSGIARRLADRQDEWARNRGYTHVTFKTINRLRGMLKFGIDRGFNIIKVEQEQSEPGEINYRIWLRRKL
ncbi:GNAT family N-acetyltransferase [Neolewinella aurantiaca]|uniref:GNAT family N-acetyltransferase n=1 Tax=Neolewinella aurantiaca TaxID=2602767 RepID=A0A5C7FMK7_9BACT|nr:GNAT family N-acetyltransferase [Neolewinella aurantiaca]TXF91362.1 GNAT family N-acetyltransferase [Neolewinella aurantiaca]